MNLDYFCGFFDGEGCISMNTGPLLQVSQANEEILNQVQSLTGVGKVYKLKDKPGRKPMWEYQAAGLQAIAVLEMIVDGLLLKKSQAEAVLKAKHLFPANQAGKKLSKEVKAKREALKQELKDLKKQ